MRGRKANTNIPRLRLTAGKLGFHRVGVVSEAKLQKRFRGLLAPFPPTAFTGIDIRGVCVCGGVPCRTQGSERRKGKCVSGA